MHNMYYNILLYHTSTHINRFLKKKLNDLLFVLINNSILFFYTKTPVWFDIKIFFVN